MLDGYYRRFIRNYVVLTQPLNCLLKKNTRFKWSELASAAFDALKEAFSTAPMLALPNFNQEFIVETDASNCGIVDVLLQ